VTSVVSNDSVDIEGVDEEIEVLVSAEVSEELQRKNDFWIKVQRII